MDGIGGLALSTWGRWVVFSVSNAAFTGGLMDWWTAAAVVSRIFVFARFSPLIFDAPRC
jgi:hypothetical protein